MTAFLTVFVAVGAIILASFELARWVVDAGFMDATGEDQ